MSELQRLRASVDQLAHACVVLGDDRTGAASSVSAAARLAGSVPEASGAVADLNQAARLWEILEADARTAARAAHGYARSLT